MPESAADYERRDQWLADWCGPREQAGQRGPLDVAFTLEAIGVTPDGFERVLELARQVRSDYVPAGLRDVVRGYRIGVCELDRSTSGHVLGRYGDVMIAAWTTDV